MHFPTKAIVTIFFAGILESETAGAFSSIVALNDRAALGGPPATCTSTPRLVSIGNNDDPDYFFPIVGNDGTNITQAKDTVLDQRTVDDSEYLLVDATETFSEYAKFIVKYKTFKTRADAHQVRYDENWASAERAMAEFKRINDKFDMFGVVTEQEREVLHTEKTECFNVMRNISAEGDRLRDERESIDAEAAELHAWMDDLSTRIDVHYALAKKYLAAKGKEILVVARPTFVAIAITILGLAAIRLNSI